MFEIAPLGEDVQRIGYPPNPGPNDKARTKGAGQQQSLKHQFVGFSQPSEPIRR